MKIAIVGGGTAGWLAALIISKRQPLHEITVIESSTIGIIGAGEGSTGSMTNVIQNITFDYGCNEADFIKKCDVTPKLGIEFVNWQGDKQSYISPIDGSFTSNQPFDYAFAHAFSEYGIAGMHRCTEDGILIEYNKDTLFQSDGPAAYHFDAHKVGKYFKEVCGEKVQHIDSEVTNVILDDSGFIKELKLKNEGILQADFFIDATGFSRVLMKKLGANWHSYKDKLPVDRAMPFLMKYNQDEPIRPVTRAIAQKTGWMWEIPLLNRKGCGYVFSSEFLNEENAQQEIEENLGQLVEPIKIIKFDSGRLDQLWIKNCLAIGLAAAFAEPLEATSIHTTIVQLENFVKEALKLDKTSTCDPLIIQMYNRQHEFMYDLLKDFLVLHYHAGRSDTEFWRYINSETMLTDQVKEIIDISKIRMPNTYNFFPVSGIAGWPLWSFILAGTGNLSSSIATKDMLMNRIPGFSKAETERFIFDIKNKIKDYPDNTSQIIKRRLIF